MRTAGNTAGTAGTHPALKRLAAVWADVNYAQKRYIALNGPVVVARRTHS